MLTPCAYSCRLQLLFILVPWLYLNTRPLVCIYLNDKHAHCYFSLSFKAQMKWPTILKVVALLILSIFEVTIELDTFLGLQFFFHYSHVVLNLLIITLWHCSLGAINLQKMFVVKAK